MRPLLISAPHFQIEMMILAANERFKRRARCQQLIAGVGAIVADVLASVLAASITCVRCS
jgi:uncharacterized membrane protein